MLQKFLDSSKLKRHFLIHTGERDFVCPHEGCGKVILSSSKSAILLTLLSFLDLLASIVEFVLVCYYLTLLKDAIYFIHFHVMFSLCPVAQLEPIIYLFYVEREHTFIKGSQKNN